MADASTDSAERIAKRLSRAGVCSRREAERLIDAGRVSIAGETVTTPATLVTADDRIEVDGKPIPEPDVARIWRLHKPSGVICTDRDPDGRKTVFSLLPEKMPRVMTVGRLDLNSEGLLLLTNDGALARRMELPATGWVRRYRVRIRGTADPEKLATLANGITVDGARYGSIDAAIDSQSKSNAWLTVALREGKNREIRKVMEALGYQVNRLIRTAYGPFQLGNLQRGALDEIPAKVVREQLGLAAPKKSHAGRRR